MLFLAQRLELPAFGVSLPGHFIVGYPGPEGTHYFSPFFNGRTLTLADCETLVHEQGIAFSEEHLAAASPAQILSRMMINLINIYSDRGDVRRTEWLERFRAALLG